MYNAIMNAVTEVITEVFGVKKSRISKIQEQRTLEFQQAFPPAPCPPPTNLKRKLGRIQDDRIDSGIWSKKRRIGSQGEVKWKIDAKGSSASKIPLLNGEKSSLGKTTRLEFENDDVLWEGTALEVERERYKKRPKFEAENFRLNPLLLTRPNIAKLYQPVLQTKGLLTKAVLKEETKVWPMEEEEKLVDEAYAKEREQKEQRKKEMKEIRNILPFEEEGQISVQSTSSPNSLVAKPSVERKPKNKTKTTTIPGTRKVWYQHQLWQNLSNPFHLEV